MLVEFRVKNFRSFRDEQTLSLVASADKTLPGNCAAEGKQKLLKVAAVYGANASGKSNLIRAIAAMRDIVLSSVAYTPGQELGVTPFLFDSESPNEPSMFEVTFYEEGVRYQYGFTVTTERIEEEWLIAYPKGPGQKWFERVFNKKTKTYDWKFSTLLKGEKASLAAKTRSNTLFLSVSAQWNNAQLTSVYKWFESKLQVADSNHTFRSLTAEMLGSVDKKTKVDREMRQAIVTVMKEADLGISDVLVKEKVDSEKVKFPEDMPSDVRKAVIRNREERFDVEILHASIEAGKNVALPLDEESDGTQKFFKLIGPWSYARMFGLTILVDELEASLHPLLTRFLVQAILHQDAYSKGAQLIFSTHDTTLLDPELFRRDQVWFTEKDKGGGTQLCPLSDYKPRKGEAMQKGYLSGRYGAVPVLERFHFE